MTAPIPRMVPTVGERVCVRVELDSDEMHWWEVASVDTLPSGAISLLLKRTDPASGGLLFATVRAAGLFADCDCEHCDEMRAEMALAR